MWYEGKMWCLLLEGVSTPFHISGFVICELLINSLLCASFSFFPGPSPRLSVHPASFWAVLCTLVVYGLTVVYLLSRVRLFATPWIAARQASLSITNSQSSLRLTSIESVMPSSHLILCRPLLFLPPIPSSMRVFSNESTLRIRWPKYWSFTFSISPSNEQEGLISFRMDWLVVLPLLKLWALSENFHSLRPHSTECQ